MRARELAVHGAWEFVADMHGDDGGVFVPQLVADAFTRAVGADPFRVAQVSTSVSVRQVVRGVHYARTRPGCAKYVTCVRGRVLDIVVDLRLGSPTFGRWDAVELSPARGAAVYLPTGLGHAFVAVEDGSTVCYLLSRAYDPSDELAVSVHDAELGLPVPAGGTLSERDRQAPTLAAAAAGGLLPSYQPGGAAC